MPPRFLTRREAADYLTNECQVKTAVSSLTKLASTGGGPKYRIVAQRALYEPADLDEYAESKVGPLKRFASETV